MEGPSRSGFAVMDGLGWKLVVGALTLLIACMFHGVMLPLKENSVLDIRPLFLSYRDNCSEYQVIQFKKATFPYFSKFITVSWLFDMYLCKTT